MRAVTHTKSPTAAITTSRRHRPVLIGLLLATLTACTNNPYRPGETAAPTFFASFDTPLTKLDPATSYYSHEGQIIDQIYEPPFTYHYLKRPYEVIPLTATALPTPAYYDTNGVLLAIADPAPETVGRVEYTVQLRSDIRYADHPCFATNALGQPFYAGADDAMVAPFAYPSEFAAQGTRALAARDYALQIRRLADPRIACPIYSTLADYILGFADLQAAYKTMLDEERARRKAHAGANYNQEKDELENPIALDYFAAPFPGVEVIDDLTYRIVLSRKYPQIIYWMCMHFFAPVPQEALDFYGEPAIRRKEFDINRCPVGTGPYFMQTFRPDEIMVLQKNSNYHADFYPTEGDPEDREAGLLADAGKPLPFIERQVYRMDKEEIPAWNKFLQGYLDASPIYSDVFDQAIHMEIGKDPDVSDAMQQRGIRLITASNPDFYYVGFNMLDPVLGDYTPERAKLRQAISIALDYNEYVDIFRNGRGLLAQGPLPPGIFGYRTGPEGTNPFVDAWNPGLGRHERRPIADAQRLMEDAGYPGGIGPDGKPLTLYFDHASGGDTLFRSVFDWMRRKLNPLGIRLEERPTDLSRFRQKKDNGDWQLAASGWLADYPDPENFLFLFYGPNGKVKYGGANYFNYESPAFDRLFRELETMQNTPERQALIDQAMTVLREDAPAVWMFYPISFTICHAWYQNIKPHNMSYNTLKYRRIDPALRIQKQLEWNRPHYAPVIITVTLLVIAMVPAIVAVWRRERRAT